MSNSQMKSAEDTFSEFYDEMKDKESGSKGYRSKQRSNDIDSIIMSESIDNMFESTSNNVIYNQNNGQIIKQNKSHKKRPS